MLSWVVKVVPQPPELPSKNTEDAKEEKPEAAPPPDVAPPPAPVSHAPIDYMFLSILWNLSSFDSHL